METSLNLLVVTTVANTFEQIRLALQQDGVNPTLERVDSLDGLRAALNDHSWDAVVSDDNASGAEVNLAMVRASDRNLPFLVCSDRSDDEYAVALMRKGANDYLKMSNIARLGPALRWAVGESRMRGARALTVESVLRQRDQAIQAATQGIVITDPQQFDNPIIFANPAFERLTGYSSEQFLGRNCRFLQGKDTDAKAVTALRDAVREGRACTIDILNYRRDGIPFWCELSISPVRDSVGRVIHFIGIQVDITSKRDRTEQSLLFQKLEALGQLAGGVAHDFKSLMTVIGGCCDLVLQNLPINHATRQLVADIHRAGERSARLTRQLLAFSRRQTLDPRFLDFNALVTDMEKILHRLVGDSIELKITLDPVACTVSADPSQLEQVLMNLAVNAADAMPRGGSLTIATRNVHLDETYGQIHPDARIGPHVLLNLTDTGIGMTPEVKARLFEPFFTTRPPQKASGLGLATAYGIVRQSGGHITVDSRPGSGSTFHVYLPRAEQTTGNTKSHPGLHTAPRGTETLLLAEDDDGVRAISSTFLTGCGYTVLEAMNGDTALRLGLAHKGPIHLFITDVVMPGTGGRDTAEHLAERYPDLRVLFISGYADDTVTRHGVLRETVHFLQKPFTLLALASKVRDILDAPLGTPGDDLRRGFQWEVPVTNQ